MDEKNHPMQMEATLDTDLMARIRDIWEASRQQAIRSVNSAHVCANWLIGKQIVEAEQGGVVESILVENGQAVEFDQPLFTIV